MDRGSRNPTIKCPDFHFSFTLLSSFLQECPLGALCSGCPSTRPQGASLVTPLSASKQGRGLCRGNSLQRAVIGWNQEPRTKGTALMLYREKKSFNMCQEHKEDIYRYF